jgi:hypothetical protein
MEREMDSKNFSARIVGNGVPVGKIRAFEVLGKMVNSGCSRGIFKIFRLS